MNIRNLRLSNFQLIEDFEGDFADGKIYFIRGDNELGKSTILKSIAILLGGKKDDLLQNGKEKGFAKMVVGDDKQEYEVSLTFTKENPKGTLKIKGPNGMSSSNVSALQSIFGYTNFDAVEFSRWSETAEGRRKQVETVKALLPKAAKDRLDAIDNERKEAYERRKNANYELSRAEKVLSDQEAGLQPGDVDKYKEPKDVTQLLEAETKRVQLEEKAKVAIARRNEIVREITEEIPAKRKRALAAFEEAKAEFERKKAAYESEVIQLEASEKELSERKAKADAWLSEYEKMDIPNKGDAVKEAEEWNRKHSMVKKVTELRSELEKSKEEADKADAKIKALDKEKETIIVKSKLPVKGLSFGDDGLMLNGVLFAPGKVSDSQIMEVAFQLVIASNPTVKVFCIARGESLGKKRLQDIINLAKENGFQGFLEEVIRGQEELQIEEYTEA